MTESNCGLNNRNIDAQSTERRVVIHKDLVAGLISAAIITLPNKAYGIVGGYDIYHPTGVYQCYTNLRSADPYWKERIDSFGEFYKNPERGFVISPEELLQIYHKMQEKGESIVGVFHSHRCFVPGEPTKIDRTLHLQCQPQTLAYLLSVLDPTKPTLRVFEILNEDQHRELDFEVLRE